MIRIQKNQSSEIFQEAKNEKCCAPHPPTMWRMPQAEYLEYQMTIPKKWSHTPTWRYLRALISSRNFRLSWSFNIIKNRFVCFTKMHLWKNDNVWKRWLVVHYCSIHLGITRSTFNFRNCEYTINFWKQKLHAKIPKFKNLAIRVRCCDLWRSPRCGERGAKHSPSKSTTPIICNTVCKFQNKTPANAHVTLNTTKSTSASPNAKMNC